MALLGPKLGSQIRPANKDYEWRESVDSLFESFIDPDSLNFPDNEVQRDPLDDLMNFFDNHMASSGSGNFDTSPMLDINARLEDSDFSWLQISPFEKKRLRLSTTRDLRKSVYPASRGKTAASESDLLGLDLLPSTQPDSLTPTFPAHARTRPSTPTTSSFKQYTTPPVIRKKQQSPPTRINKQPRPSIGSSVKMISPSSYSQRALWARRIEDAADQLNLKMPFEGRPAALSSPVHLSTESLHGRPLASDRSQSGPYADETEPLSPFSSVHHHFQPPNTPIASTAIDDQQPNSRSPFHKAVATNFPKTLMNQNPDLFGSLMTPPQSSQMPSVTWVSALDDQSISASPAFSPSGYKADSWWLGTTGESSCGATPSNDFSGLGIHGLHMNDDLATASSLMMSCDPSPSFTAAMVVTTTPAPSLVSGVNRPLASPISASASPSANMPYPLSPLQTIHQSQQQPLQSPQQPPPQQQQPTFYRRHQRHNTVGTPIAIGQTEPYNTRSARLKSASPQPTPIRPHHHRRSKISHHSRRKSSAENKKSAHDGSRSASIGFVNYTPEDRRKILTGVAPSGSSKTKARREKEAAEKRRKLSEAAKKAVLEAGGDLETLEREGLLVMEHGL